MRERVKALSPPVWHYMFTGEELALCGSRIPHFFELSADADVDGQDCVVCRDLHDVMVTQRRRYL